MAFMWLLSARWATVIDFNQGAREKIMDTNYKKYFRMKMKSWLRFRQKWSHLVGQKLPIMTDLALNWQLTSLACEICHNKQFWLASYSESAVTSSIKCLHSESFMQSIARHYFLWSTKLIRADTQWQTATTDSPWTGFHVNQCLPYLE